LPREIDSPDVLFEFRFLRLERGEFAEVSRGNLALGDWASVVREGATEFVDFSDGTKATLAGNENLGVSILPRDEGVKKASGLDRSDEFLVSGGVVLPTLSVGGD
jgi:hypothetical protein